MPLILAGLGWQILLKSGFSNVLNPPYPFLTVWVFPRFQFSCLFHVTCSLFISSLVFLWSPSSHLKLQYFMNLGFNSLTNYMAIPMQTASYNNIFETNSSIPTLWYSSALDTLLASLIPRIIHHSPLEVQHSTTSTHLPQSIPRFQSNTKELIHHIIYTFPPDLIIKPYLPINSAMHL